MVRNPDYTEGAVLEEQIFTSPWNNTFTVPSGVYSISAVLIGAGGGGAGGGVSGDDVSGSGGGGGALAWFNDFSVTPGETFKVYVGDISSGGDGSGDQGEQGSPSYIERNSDNLRLATANGGDEGEYSSSDSGGFGGTYDFPTNADELFSSYGGGNGGRGGDGDSNSAGGAGGGAGGYSGDGGDGGYSNFNNSQTGGTGGAGGGGESDGSGSGGGGGVGIYGQGPSGEATGDTEGSAGAGGLGGSGGEDGTPGSGSGGDGGLYGGGGGAPEDDDETDGGTGAPGVVRIIWGGGSFPNQAVEIPKDTELDNIKTGGSQFTRVFKGSTLLWEYDNPNLATFNNRTSSNPVYSPSDFYYPIHIDRSASTNTDYRIVNRFRNYSSITHYNEEVSTGNDELQNAAVAFDENYVYFSTRGGTHSGKIEKIRKSDAVIEKEITHSNYGSNLSMFIETTGKGTIVTMENSSDYIKLRSTSDLSIIADLDIDGAPHSTLPWVYRGFIYIVGYNDILHVFDSATGDKIIQFYLGYEVHGPICSYKNGNNSEKIVTTHDYGEIKIFNPDNNESFEVVRIGGYSGEPHLIQTHGSEVFGCHHDYVFKFDLDSNDVSSTYIENNMGGLYWFQISNDLIGVAGGTLYQIDKNDLSIIAEYTLGTDLYPNYPSDEEEFIFPAIGYRDPNTKIED